ncbi:MAG: toxic anion resistance protein [Elusimicrobiota bacterium]
MSLATVNKEEVKKDLGLVEPKDVAVEKEVDPQLDKKASEVVGMLLDLKGDDIKAREQSKASVENIGVELQKRAAEQSEKLKEPVKKMSFRSEEGSDVAKSLIDLRIQVEELDPARFDFDAGWATRMLGYLPGVGTPLKRYFSRYESAQTVINSIIESLEQGREQLKRDNITLKDDQVRMREITKKLIKAINLAQLIDKKLSDKVENEIPQEDPRSRFIKEELLFPLRQRIVDLQQQLAVNQQGVLAMEIIIRNNKELIRGVNRALQVTINALQVAVTVALALADQKIVLEKVQALSATTSDLIAKTAARLKEQGPEIHKMASSTQLDIDALRTAFSDIRDAMEDIATFRSNALPAMAKNIEEMEALTAEAGEAIKKKEEAAKTSQVIPIEIE